MMTCKHEQENRSDISHLCNVRHNSNTGAHEFCTTECHFNKEDCPHVFGHQVCDCGQEFVGQMGEWYKDTCQELKDKL